MALKVFLYIASAVFAVIGNLGHLNKEWNGPAVLVHYIGLAVVFIYAFVKLGSRTALIVLMADIVAALLSQQVFSRM